MKLLIKALTSLGKSCFVSRKRFNKGIFYMPDLESLLTDNIQVLMDSIQTLLLQDFLKKNPQILATFGCRSNSSTSVGNFNNSYRDKHIIGRVLNLDRNEDNKPQTIFHYEVQCSNLVLPKSNDIHLLFLRIKVDNHITYTNMSKQEPIRKENYTLWFFCFQPLVNFFVFPQS